MHIKQPGTSEILVARRKGHTRVGPTLVFRAPYFYIISAMLWPRNGRLFNSEPFRDEDCMMSSVTDRLEPTKGVGDSHGTQCGQRLPCPSREIHFTEDADETTQKGSLLEAPIKWREWNTAFSREILQQKFSYLTSVLRQQRRHENQFVKGEKKGASNS